MLRHTFRSVEEHRPSRRGAKRRGGWIRGQIDRGPPAIIKHFLRAHAVPGTFEISKADPRVLRCSIHCRYDACVEVLRRLWDARPASKRLPWGWASVM